ncbi:MAG: hypothetical protein HYY17_14560 [Planctomycetes bacterium]|nr:hypothetical protein [Planctomycetota bacterium]
MFIRSREEAMDVLAEILTLSERRDQIIRCTVAIMECLDAEARTFMADCQAMLIEGGLETLRERRREAMERLHETEVVAIIDPEEDRQLEALASAADALRFADVVFAVLPELSFQKWEIARALLAQEQILREQVVAALQARQSTPDDLAGLRSRVEAIVTSHLPPWRGRAEEMRRACRDVLRTYELDGDPEMIFTAIASSDDRALPFIEMLNRDSAGAVAYIRKLQEWTATVRALEQPRT